MKAIACVNDNDGIGFRNRIPWKIGHNSIFVFVKYYFMVNTPYRVRTDDLGRVKATSTPLDR